MRISGSVAGTTAHVLCVSDPEAFQLFLDEKTGAERAAAKPNQRAQHKYEQNEYVYSTLHTLCTN